MDRASEGFACKIALLEEVTMLEGKTRIPLIDVEMTGDPFL